MSGFPFIRLLAWLGWLPCRHPASVEVLETIGVLPSGIRVYCGAGQFCARCGKRL